MSAPRSCSSTRIRPTSTTPCGPSSPRGAGTSGCVLHGNGPRSRMARFEASTLPELIRHTGALDGKRVLDFGCGSGTITPSLALRAKEVVAFDVNAEAVAITRARLREHGLDHVTVHHADSYRDVADQLGSFDLVVAHAVFEHVPLSVPGLRVGRAAAGVRRPVAGRSPLHLRVTQPVDATRHLLHRTLVHPMDERRIDVGVPASDPGGAPHRPRWTRADLTRGARRVGLHVLDSAARAARTTA